MTCTAFPLFAHSLLDAISADAARDKPSAAPSKAPNPKHGEPEAETDCFTHADQQFQASLGRLTAGVSPSSVGLAYADWLAHLAIAPGTQLGIAAEAIHKSCDVLLRQWCGEGTGETPCVSSLPQDQRFDAKGWQQFPFSLYADSFLATQEWLQNTVEAVKGVTPHHTEVVQFINRQWLDALSPSNFLPTNPEVLEKTKATQGQNLLRGLNHCHEDWQHVLAGKLPPHLRPYSVGKDMALTKGKVVFRNRLIELIQYTPTTAKTYAEPILIVPAWIMKYYILDLCPGKSLVEYLVGQGHSVFMISWKNPDANDAELTMTDYLKLGIMAALDTIEAIIPGRKVHAAGYCLGGTLLSIAAAWLARRNHNRLQSVTLFAAQTDFEEAGELMLFVDESQLAFLDSIMQEQGYLDKYQMKTIFQMLRSNDLIWSYVIQHYLLGERPHVNELMAWSADATRMPHRMHRQYLERLYLHNELAEGHYRVDGKVVTLKNVPLPMFAVATERDHIAPWKSVYKLHLHTDTDVTFVLTNGGHNAGIVSELNHPRRSYRIHTTPEDAPYIGPDRWLEKNRLTHSGSWWPQWHRWLAHHSASGKVAPPPMGNEKHPVLCDAPGTYVLQE